MTLKTLQNTWNEKWTLEATRALNENRIGYLKALKKYLPDLSNKTLLEEGCGSAIFSQLFKSTYPDAKVIALDYSDKALDQVPEEMGIIKILADVFDVPLADNSVDLVFTEGLLEHYPEDWPKIIDEQLRIVKPGGYIINSVPNIFNFPRTFAYYVQGEKFRYYPAPPFSPFGKIKKYCEKVGLEVIAIEGWAPFYPAKTMYEWDDKSKMKRYPWYTHFFKACAKIAESPYNSINNLFNKKLDRIFGWEFMIVTRKKT